jgi:hypothetical protein
MDAAEGLVPQRGSGSLELQVYRETDPSPGRRRWLTPNVRSEPAQSGHPRPASRRVYNSPLPGPATMPSVSAVLLATKEIWGHSADAFGISDDVKLDDLVIDDCEGHHAVRLPIERDNDTSGTVISAGRSTAAGLGTEARLPSDSRCAADDHRRTRSARPKVGPEDDVSVEHGDQLKFVCCGHLGAL